jgi:3-methyladenine DNA glycosylase AlkD
MTRPLPDEVLDRVVQAYEAHRDPERAAPAAAYMRDRFEFLGLGVPRQRSLGRKAVAGLPDPTEPELATTALTMWEQDEREYQYFACDYLRAHVGVPGPGFLGTTRTLLTTKSWWDTVDPLATRFVGELVQRHPQLRGEMDAWASPAETNPWLIRTAILHQLHYGKGTDTERLFGYCTAQAGHTDFFVRKAIGWALRQYARTEPHEVRGYLAANRHLLSPLSLREAAKHL